MRIILFGNTDWYLYNFRLSLARAIRDSGMEVALVSPPGNYGALLKEQGFNWYPLAMNRRSLNPVSECRVLLRLSRLFSCIKPDLVHNFTIKCVVYGTLAAQMTGVRGRVNAVAGMGHVFSNNDSLIKILRPAVSTLLKFSLGAGNTRLILQNPDDRDVFLQKGLIDPKKIKLIRSSGVDTEKFKPESSTRYKTNRSFRVLLASRLLWAKGIGDFVSASQRIRESGQEVEFLLAGAPDEGNPASIPDAQIQAWASKGLIRFCGQVEDMKGLLGEVDVAVLPTTYGEGVPRILVEAAASGLPIVATDVPGCREIVADGENGYLVKPHDVKMLMAKILCLKKNADLCNRMGLNGRVKVLIEFDEKIVIQKTLDVYRGLITA